MRCIVTLPRTAPDTSDEVFLRLAETQEREHNSEDTAIGVLVALQPVHEGLVLYPRIKGLVDVFLGR